MMFEFVILNFWDCMNGLGVQSIFIFDVIQVVDKGDLDIGVSINDELKVVNGVLLLFVVVEGQVENK